MSLEQAKGRRWPPKTLMVLPLVRLVPKTHHTDLMVQPWEHPALMASSGALADIKGGLAGWSWGFLLTRWGHLTP